MTDITTEDCNAAVEQGGSLTAAAAILGCSRQTVRRRLATGFEIEERPPSKHLDVADLIQHRIERYGKLHAAKTAQRMIDVKIRDDAPIGVLHFGDPHVDDDGTDLETLFAHAAIVRDTPGMFGANIGDITNNWVGGLKRIYSEQSTSEADGWRIAEHFLRSVDWLYLIKGNHDAWSGASDPLDWILRDNPGVMQAHGLRLRLKFPNRREVRISAAHNFKGNSQWNPAHGVAKAAQMGIADHILINGHTHVSAYNKVKSKDPTLGIDGGVISHCIQIAAYKVHDKYAEQLGLADHAFSPCAVTVINPHAAMECNIVQVFDDPELAADYLTWIRGRANV